MPKSRRKNSNLVVLPTPKARCVKDTVELLESLLKRAKAGEIVSVAVVAVRANEELGTFFSKRQSTSQLVGMLELAKYDLIRDWNEIPGEDFEPNEGA